jgi:hypothetical protein
VIGKVKLRKFMIRSDKKILFKVQKVKIVQSVENFRTQILVRSIYRSKANRWQLANYSSSERYTDQLEEESDSESRRQLNTDDSRYNWALSSRKASRVLKMRKTGSALKMEKKQETIWLSLDEGELGAQLNWA